MGMFDYVEVFSCPDIPDFVPEKYVPFFKASFERNGFQTKDLENLMCHYMILENGELHDAGFDYKNAKKMNYHGVFNMYTLVPLNEEEDVNGKRVFVEYEVKYTDGVLQHIKWISPQKEELQKLI